MKLLFSCSVQYQLGTVYFILLDTLLVHFSHSWDSELNTRREIRYQRAPMFIIHLLNKEKMANFVIQPRCKIPEKLSYSTNFNAWRGSIAQWSVFIRLYNHRLLTTEKVVDECKAIKPVNKCSRKNCQRLEKSLLCRSGIVVLTYPHLITRGGWENLRKLCKPERQSRVRITFKKFSNLPLV